MGNILLLEVIRTATAALCVDRARLRSSQSRMAPTVCSKQKEHLNISNGNML